MRHVCWKCRKVRDEFRVCCGVMNSTYPGEAVEVDRRGRVVRVEDAAKQARSDR